MSGPGREEYERDRSQDFDDRVDARAIVREDYDKDQKAAGKASADLKARADQRDRKDLVLYILLGLLALLAGLSVVNTFLAAERAKTTGEDIRESQYLACVQNGNKLRQDVRDEFVDLKEGVLIPVFSEVAATIPPDAASYKILTDSVALMKRRIETIGERIVDVDCLEQYPPLDGQTYPDVTVPS